MQNRTPSIQGTTRTQTPLTVPSPRIRDPPIPNHTPQPHRPAQLRYAPTVPTPTSRHAPLHPNPSAPTLPYHRDPTLPPRSASTQDDSAEPPKKKSGRKDDVGRNKAVARLEGFHDDKMVERKISIANIPPQMTYRHVYTTIYADDRTDIYRAYPTPNLHQGG